MTPAVIGGVAKGAVVASGAALGVQSNLDAAAAAATAAGVAASEARSIVDGLDLSLDADVALGCIAPAGVTLDGAARAALLAVLDAYPCDGAVSIVEWKRSCKTAAKSGQSLFSFVMCLAEAAAS